MTREGSCSHSNSSENRASRLPHSCCLPQMGQRKRPPLSGSRWRLVRSVSTPVNTGCPVRGHLIMIKGERDSGEPVSVSLNRTALVPASAPRPSSSSPDRCLESGPQQGRRLQLHSPISFWFKTRRSSTVSHFGLDEASSPSLASMLSASISQSCANWRKPGRAVRIRSFVSAAFARHSSAPAR